MTIESRPQEFAGDPAAGLRPGDRVMYSLDEEDVTGVSSRRANFDLFQAMGSHGKHPHGKSPQGGSGASGHIAHIGLPVHVGQELPADVIIVNGLGRLCLKVLLPGSDVQWVENAAEGDGPGHWRRITG